MQTVVHVTHEAIRKIGGIGAVLQGLFTSSVYLASISRNILVGPYWETDETGEQRLGPEGEVLYSSLDSIYRSPLTTALREVERTFGVGIVYGRRRYFDKASGIASAPEVLLIDVNRFEAEKLAKFKFHLWENFAIESSKYDSTWDYEQWVRLAQPVIACLHAIGAVSALDPCVILSHEYMGMPTALAAIMEGSGANFRTIFYAHEVATVRRIVEESPGQDTMFYNVMRAAVAEGKYLEDVFGDQSSFYRHALVSAARYCDGIFAVGDHTLAELRFLGPEFAEVNARVAYNGVPCWKITVQEKLRSRDKLKEYCQTLLKYEPDFVFTHVTRLVPSKGLWRDLRVLEHIETQLRARNESAVLFTLSTEAAARKPEDIRRMEQWYHWPVVHREGHADLTGGEAIYYQGVQEFNAQSRNLKVVFINQFGFDGKSCGTRLPVDTDFFDIRKGSDVEFGQSTYEPFGIAQVEPISFGGICVFSNVCGCAGFVEKAAGGRTSNAIIADYTNIGIDGMTSLQLLTIGQGERDRVEDRVSREVADEIMKRLPRSQKEFEAFIERGYALAQKMSWDAVAREYVVPGIQKVVAAKNAEDGRASV